MDMRVLPAYRSLKTGGVYRRLATGTDTTSSRYGLPVVIYCPDDNEHTIYVRSEEEFEEEFRCCSYHNVHSGVDD